MAFCITFVSRYTLLANNSGNNNGNANLIATQIPVFTLATNPQTCTVLAMSGAEYQAIINNNNTAANNAITANNNANTALITANGVNSIATLANTLATQAKLIADNALAQTNALANITTGLNTFNQVFKIPDKSMLGQAWSVGFILPMTIALISYGVAKLVNFWD